MASRSLNRSGSLTRGTLIQMAVRLGVVVIAATLLTYLLITSTLTASSLETLSRYVVERADRESQLFQLAESNVRLLKEAYLRERAVLATTDPAEEFGRLFSRWPDGAIRRKPDQYDINHVAGAYADGRIAETPDLRRRLVAMNRVVSAFGPAWQRQFVTSYVSALDNVFAVYWPRLDWAAAFTPEHDVKLEKFVAATSPQQNPGRGTVWFGPWSDGIADGWFATCLVPIDDEYGIWTGYVGTSAAIGDILARTTERALDGTHNLIISSDGRLVAHPDLMTEIAAANGEYDIRRHGDDHMRSVYEHIRAQDHQGAVVEHAGYGEYLGVARINGPNWYLVTIFPKAQVTAQAGSAAKAVLGLGTVALLLELLVVFLVLRHRVTHPLTALIAAARKVTEGDLETRVPVGGADELAELGRAFNTMTERVAGQQQALAETVARFERMVGGSTSALWEFNIRTLDFYLAPRFHELLGWDNPKDPFSYWEAMIHPDDHRRVMDVFEAHLEHNAPFQVEYRLRHADGHYIWVHVRAQTQRDEHGRATLMAGSVTDISKRKRAEATLAAYQEQLEQTVRERTAEARESEDRFRTLAEATSEGILVHAGGLVLDCNGVMDRMFRCACPCDAEPRTGCPRLVADLFAPECRHEALAALEAADPAPHEFLGRRSDGSTFPIEMRTTRAVKNGAPILVTAIGDRTLQKALHESLTRLADEARAASRAKSEFLATMSHEIRTPMNGIIGMAQLLLDSPLTPEQRDHMETLCSSGEALQTLLNDILDLSKLESGRLELDRRSFGLRALVSQVSELFRTRAEQKGIELAWSVDDGVPDNLVGDPLRLRQVLTNLVGNAVKFTELGGVRIFAEADMADGQSCRLSVRVCDTGIGIPDSVLGNLFAPFSQGDASIAGRFGGTGLGLAICRRLVELMDGRLGADSREAEGSTFWFQVPLAIDPTKTQMRDMDPSPAAPPSRPLTILLAEDNPVNQKVVEAFLRRRGHQITLAENGAQAVAQASQRRFDAVLMDMQMPVMDGIAATRCIRALPPPFDSVPIIALTANAYRSDAESCLQAGMSDFLAKPVDFGRLLAVLAQWTGNEPPPPPPEPEEEQAEPVYDPAKHQTSIRLIGDDGVAEVRERFNTLVADLTQALNGDEDDKRRANLAHATAGCASYLGLVRLTTTCRTYEKAILHDEAEKAEQLRTELVALVPDSLARLG